MRTKAFAREFISCMEKNAYIPANMAENLARTRAKLRLFLRKRGFDILEPKNPARRLARRLARGRARA